MAPRTPLPRRSPGGDGDPAHPVPVYVAAWCRTVGTTWTLELRELDHGTPASRPVDWVCSGVPTTLPPPDALAPDLLADRGLLLHRDAAAPADEPTPPVRRAIGHVTRDPEVLRLARLVGARGGTGTPHPVVLAARWIGAGVSVAAAAKWITAGVLLPPDDRPPAPTAEGTQRAGPLADAPQVLSR